MSLRLELMIFLSEYMYVLTKLKAIIFSSFIIQVKTLKTQLFRQHQYLCCPQNSLSYCCLIKIPLTNPLFSERWSSFISSSQSNSNRYLFQFQKFVLIFDNIWPIMLFYLQTIFSLIKINYENLTIKLGSGDGLKQSKRKYTNKNRFYFLKFLKIS